MNAWSFAGLWNKSLDLNNQRPYEKRDYIWASELGGSYYDRYMKMNGRKPTTPPNLRSRRKFEGGNLAEWIVQQILKRAGILQSTQEYITYDGVMRVTGKADFTAGGKIEQVFDHEFSDFPETFQVVAERTIANLKEKYPNGLQEMNLEIKSCSGMMFDRYMKAPSPQHALQAFHYALNTKKPTMLVYISRDDFRIAEHLILPGSRKWLDKYEADLEAMSITLSYSMKIMKADCKEELLTWDGKKFSKNWKVEYSNWLTDYGFKKPEDYAKPAQSIAIRLNNIVKKIKEGKAVDGKVNLKTLEECFRFYPGAEEIISYLVLKKGFDDIKIDQGINVEEYKSITKTTYSDIYRPKIIKNKNVLTQKKLEEQFNKAKGVHDDDSSIGKP